MLRRSINVLCLAVTLYSGALVAGWQEALPDARKIGDGELRILGLAIYSAQFWSPSQPLVEPLDLNAPFALELTYQRSISRESLIAASLKEIRRLSPRALPQESLDSWEREMRLAFVDVQAGDQITAVYLPGKGAHFYSGAQLRHVVRDEQFARAFFAIWLDRRTRNPTLRTRLLGASQP